ncbi:NAD(P)H-hydrate epimerase [Ruminiclostridium sufflavum DSM 19573]|uniref:Bifunctional NAD(P)H-hydrate repair enzyme n=1 Tax=Ruminiclostridium sufflavum DSM 19573 TaxID=1121337 RepID=A0A318XL02_9FIRM|nr:NAD(P)H-hydrate dehydratase [Ruminiclostridium sufflavum]PYG88198.1 NAD(P)H-hydrate epimerase [Ruminiclostridium sufflavum DSM 19573]
MKAVTGTDMGRIDKFSIEQIGIPGIVLMENAALKVVKHIEMYLEQKKPALPCVLIFAGKGNNAGDALAAARHLIVAGVKVKVYCLFGKESFAGDAKINFDILENISADIDFIIDDLKEESELKALSSDIKDAQVVLDGIFGTGFKGQIKGHIAKVAELINQNSDYTISIDIASGIEASTGKTAVNCVKAHKTVTFELPKIGQLIYPGVYNSGQLAVESIGMPEQSINSVNLNTALTDSAIVNSVIPERKDEFNKGNCGKVAVITGSEGMAGSGCIAAKASLRTGSGLVYIAAPSSLLNIYQSVVPEAVAIGLPDYNGIISELSTESILKLLKKCSAAAIGPGISTGESIYNIIRDIAENVSIPLVLDADALNVIAKDIGILNKFHKDVVLTPHPGEMSRLTGLDISYIQQNRIEVARKYACLWEVTVVLKGARTIIADKTGEIYINPTGNSGMATAGSGDALSGIIASLIGQGASVFKAAVAGVYIHGLAGDIAAGVKGIHGLNAMDIAENIPCAIIRTTLIK